MCHVRQNEGISFKSAIIETGVVTYKENSWVQSVVEQQSKLLELEKIYPNKHLRGYEWFSSISFTIFKFEIS